MKRKEKKPDLRRRLYREMKKRGMNQTQLANVLGVPVVKIGSGLSYGGYNRTAMQKTLAEHARKLEDAGAKIIKHTKNRLVARYKNETGVYVISPLTSKTFYEKEWRTEK